MDEEWGAEQWHTGQAGIERLALTAGLLPDCMLGGADDCFPCAFESAPSCPVKVDPDYRGYILWLQERYLAYMRKRGKQLAVLKKVLKVHKMPIHWEYLAILALQESPNLFASAHSVRGLVYFNPETFCMEADGVFGLAAWRKSNLR